jgi:DNA primase
LLPEGQDPDDLARSSGRVAIEEVIGAARPLAEIIWLREIEGGAYATPERRAALEARINELSQSIRDETVRKYYRQDLQERLRSLFQPAANSNGGYRGYGQQGAGYGQGQGGFRPRQGGESGGRFQPQRGGFRGRNGNGGSFAQPGAADFRAGPYQAASAQLAASSLMRGQRSALSRREALIILMLLNHPWLLHEHLEEVAALELAHPEAHRLRAGLIAAWAADHHHSGDEDEQSEKLRADLAKAGFSELIQRVERSITTGAVWGVRPGAAIEDVLATWKQLVALHHQWHSLLRELRDAELALGQEATDSNYGWLQDVKARLAAVDGTEALIEGFGESSGRAQKGM